MCTEIHKTELSCESLLAKSGTHSSIDDGTNARQTADIFF